MLATVLFTNDQTYAWGLARLWLLRISPRHWAAATRRLRDQAARAGQGPRSEPPIWEERTLVYHTWMHQVNT
jgi:hypothetical protein